MKAFLLLFLFPLASFAQTHVPMKDGKVFYEQIDTISAVDKGELFNRCKIWFVNTFNSANAVIQMDDRDAGILIGKGFTQLEVGNFMTGPMTSNIHYTVNVSIKEEKYRIQVYDIYATNNAGSTTYTIEDLLKYPKMNKKRIEKIDASIKDLISSLKIAANKPASSSF